MIRLQLLQILGTIDRLEVGEAAVFHHPAQAFARTFAVGGDQYPALAGALRGDVFAHGLENISLRLGTQVGEIPPLAPAAVRRPFRSAEGRQGLPLPGEAAPFLLTYI